MASRRKEIVVAKEDAVFWLDKHGFWHSKEGKFQHKKIINYFHSSIRKDKAGYHLSQTYRDYKEKVYFPYEDTALFVFEVVKGDDIILVLNNKKRIKLKPRKLWIKDDSLYMNLGEDLIKFSENGLVRIADLIEYENDQYFMRVRDRRYKIHQV
jgi:hypothetical protein